MKIPDYENKSISKQEALELLQLLHKKFKKSNMRFIEIVPTDDSETVQPNSDWEKLFSEFSNYLKFVINIKMTKGVFAISFFNTKYGFYVEGSWIYQIEGKGSQWRSSSLNLAIAESITPDSVTEFVVKNLHIFGE